MNVDTSVLVASPTPISPTFHHARDPGPSFHNSLPKQTHFTEHAGSSKQSLDVETIEEHLVASAVPRLPAALSGTPHRISFSSSVRIHGGMRPDSSPSSSKVSPREETNTSKAELNRRTPIYDVFQNREPLPRSSPTLPSVTGTPIIDPTTGILSRSPVESSSNLAGVFMSANSSGYSLRQPSGRSSAFASRSSSPASSIYAPLQPSSKTCPSPSTLLQYRLNKYNNRNIQQDSSPISQLFGQMIPPWVSIFWNSGQPEEPVERKKSADYLWLVREQSRTKMLKDRQRQRRSSNSVLQSSTFEDGRGRPTNTYPNGSRRQSSERSTSRLGEGVITIPPPVDERTPLFQSFPKGIASVDPNLDDEELSDDLGTMPSDGGDVFDQYCLNPWANLTIRCRKSVYWIYKQCLGQDS